MPWIYPVHGGVDGGQRMKLHAAGKPRLSTVTLGSEWLTDYCDAAPRPESFA
jgi:hypothetical protein